MPKVSVIIPVYNSEKYLHQCMDSIVSQTLRDIEIICVNDGSTDNSLSVLDNYAKTDNRIHVVTKENEGLGAASARNIGMKLATGEYLSFLDSDDWFELDMLELMVKCADSTDADVIITDAWNYDDITQKKHIVTSNLNPKYIPDSIFFTSDEYRTTLFQMTHGAAWNKLFRHSFVKKTNIVFQKIRYTDDAYFTLSHIALAKVIAIVNKPLMNYRVNVNSSQSGTITNNPDSAYLQFYAIQKALRECGIYKELKKSFINHTTDNLRFCYDRLTTFDSFKYLHNKLNEEIFKTLEIIGQDEVYFYDNRVYQWYRLVSEHSAEEVAFMAARGYGAPMTTGILRFKYPVETLPDADVVKLKRSSIESTYHYAQILFAGFEDKVKWVADDGICLRDSDKKISIGMTDAERYEVLKDRAIDVPYFDIEKLEQIDPDDYEALERIGKSGAFKILRKIGEDFGVFRDDYTTQDVDIEFGFSKANLRESIYHQKYSYCNYVQMLIILDNIISNAIGLEAHKERYNNPGSRVDTIYTFISAFSNSADVIPVLFNIKTFTNSTASLYVVVTMHKIIRSRIVAYVPDAECIKSYTSPTSINDSLTEAHSDVNVKRSRILGHIPDTNSIKSYPLPASFELSLSDLLSNVNVEDRNLLKYIPDGFLCDKQKEAKQIAIKETADYIDKKNKRYSSKPDKQATGDSIVSEAGIDYKDDENTIVFVFHKKGSVKTIQ